MYIRSWNGLLSRFLGRAPSTDCHLIEFVSAGQNNLTPEVFTTIVRGAIQDFWFLTAGLVGTPAYMTLLTRLSNSAVFKDEWMRLAFVQADERAIGLPSPAWREDSGSYLVCPFSIEVPPTYYLRRYIPVEQRAIDRIAALAAEGNEIHFDAADHWQDS